MQRLLVLVKGSHAATQCTTIQESVVKFGNVPITVVGEDKVLTGKLTYGLNLSTPDSASITFVLSPIFHVRTR